MQVISAFKKVIIAVLYILMLHVMGYKNPALFSCFKYRQWEFFYGKNKNYAKFPILVSVWASYHCNECEIIEKFPSSSTLAQIRNNQFSRITDLLLKKQPK